VDPVKVSMKSFVFIYSVYLTDLCTVYHLPFSYLVGIGTKTSVVQHRSRQFQTFPPI